MKNLPAIRPAKPGHLHVGENQFSKLAVDVGRYRRFQERPSTAPGIAPDEYAGHCGHMYVPRWCLTSSARTRRRTVEEANLGYRVSLSEEKLPNGFAG